MKESKIWSGRFSDSTDPGFEAFSSSLSFDRVLFDADIEVNRAWADALFNAGIYTEEECSRVSGALEAIRSDYHKGALEFSSRDEDIHSAVERWLTERLGETGARIHTGRSRNDQVVTDLRLFMRDSIDAIAHHLVRLQTALRGLAVGHSGTVMPGMTHLRMAQPVSLAHYFLALFFQLQRDRERFLQARARCNKMPLGSGALAGSGFDIDRGALAASLGFDGPTENSIDATSDRDFVDECLFACAQVMVHLSRAAEDLIIWSSEPFALVEIDQRYATGSSMMPQKLNPDSLELIRGKTARVIGDLCALLTLQKGVPNAYARDLQEDKEPLFHALRETGAALAVFRGVCITLHVNVERMREMLDPVLYATDLADYLVRKGMPFRQAHHLVGRIVADAEKQNISLDRLGLAVLAGYSPLFESDAELLFDPQSSLSRRNLAGGTGEASIAQQLELAGHLLSAAPGKAR